MKNCKIDCVDGLLVITIDPTKDLGSTKSEKSTLVGTTAGPVTIVGLPELEGLRVNVNVHRPIGG